MLLTLCPLRVLTVRALMSISLGVAINDHVRHSQISGGFNAS
jgi:hypothetical protein